MTKFKIHQGFTLIEILVSIAIFTVIGIASFSVLTRIQEADNATAQHSLEIENLQRAHWTMERDFMQMTVRQVRINEQAPSTTLLTAGEEIIESDSQAIAFTRNGWSNPFGMQSRGNVQPVAYRLREGVLERLYTLYPDPAQGTEYKVRPLLEGVESLEFRFWHNNKWQKTWEQKNALPHAVEVSIKSQLNGEIRWVFLTTGAQIDKAN